MFGKRATISSPALAYSMLTHFALGNLMESRHPCCPECCAPCAALSYLDQNNMLDATVKVWSNYEDGADIFAPKNAPPWWVDNRVDRDWLYKKWSSHEDPCH